MTAKYLCFIFHQFYAYLCDFVLNAIVSVQNVHKIVDFNRLTREWAKRRERVCERSEWVKQSRALWSESADWVAWAEERNKRPSGPLKPRLSLTRNEPSVRLFTSSFHQSIRLSISLHRLDYREIYAAECFELDDDNDALPPLPKANDKYVLVSQDEKCWHSNEIKKRFWLLQLNVCTSNGGYRHEKKSR